MQILPVLWPIFLQLKRYLFCRRFFAYKYCKLRLILAGCVLAGAIYFMSLLVHFKLFLIIVYFYDDDMTK